MPCRLFADGIAARRTLFEPHYAVQVEQYDERSSLVQAPPPEPPISTPDLTVAQTGRLISAVYHAKLQVDETPHGL